MTRHTGNLELLGVASLTLACGCRQPAYPKNASASAPVSIVATTAQPTPTSPLALYATPAAPTILATSESEPPDILTLRQNLKSRRLKPGEPPILPPESIVEASFDLSGDWTTGSGFSGWTLRLTRRAGDNYDASLHFWDCTSREQVEGVGRYRNGVLTLDLSVMSDPAMSLNEFKTLHALRAGGFPVLARPSEAESLMEFERICEAARVKMKDHLGLRPWPTFIRRLDAATVP